MSDQFQKFRQRIRADMATPAPEGAAETATAAADDFDPAALVPDGVRPFSVAIVKRQPGFFIVMATNKRRHWIWYHSIQNLMMEEEGGAEFLEFTHEALAVTIKGRDLDQLQNLIAFGKVAAIFEPSGAPLQSAEYPTVIQGVRATPITERKDEKPTGPKLVKP